MRHTFDSTPTIKYTRSQFDLSHGVKTTMSIGKLYPIDWQEVLPGDTFKTKAPFVARVSSTFVKPIIDNLFVDVYSFWVPYRLIDDEFDKVFGVAQPSSYFTNMRKDVPHIKAGRVESGSVADYLGLPVGVSVNDGSLIQAYPFRAFALIYNTFFRNENLINETFIHTENASTTAENLNNNQWSNNNYTGKLPNVAKRKDYFTTCLPSPQKGPSVSIPMGTQAPLQAFLPPTNVSYTTVDGYPISPTIMGSGNFSGNSSMYGGWRARDTDEYSDVSSFVDYTQIEGYADLTEASGASINDWRYAFALQRMLEKDARYGSRYSEYTYAHFGVEYPDVYNFPEYLGGGRTPLNVQQVAQTSQSTAESPLANLSGYSLTNGFTRYTKSFKEHGIIMTVACIRQVHSYEQGVQRKWMRKTREDFYDPSFAFIGEQPVYKSELYNSGTFSGKGTVFGYQEAWSEYRFQPNLITGQLRTAQTGGRDSLDMWTLGDYYQNTPSLTKEFIEETSTYIDRVLSVDTEHLDNFIFDFYFKMQAVRVMPTYSTPGLIDHN